ncbi:MAG: putative RNA uridine N3 methyltransferase, partial [Candidatus Bathyarchaeales archaeon]
EISLIATLLSYMETPQYLRKSLFTLKPELRYAGILPPLRTPHHPLNRKIKSLKVGEYREGVIISNTREGALIDIGVEQPALLADKQLPMQKRVTVKIARTEKRVEVELASRDEISEYWGYVVTVEPKSLSALLKRGNFDLTIATSKHGAPLAKVAEKLSERWKKAGKILLAFGAPTQGLYEIAKKEGLNLNEIVDFVVNTIPLQGTETVRTEEALLASLAIFNANLAFNV